MEQLKYIMGYGFHDCKEDDNYEVLWSINDNEKELIEKFDNLKDARNFFDELNETKALVNMNIEDEFQKIIAVYLKKND